jgi:hypothetical protein
VIVCNSLKESTNTKMMIESQLKEEISSELQKEEKPIVEPANLDVDGSLICMLNVLETLQR